VYTMGEKFFAIASSLVLVLFSAGLALGQPGESDKNNADDEVRQLGENFVVTLVLESAGVKESFTILTATEDFLVETQVGKGEERMELQFEGRLLFRERQLIIGERRIESSKPILVRYRIMMHGVEKQEEGGFTFGLQGSAFLEENKEVAIARTTNMTLELRISRD
jgi:hypothetical protein